MSYRFLEHPNRRHKVVNISSFHVFTSNIASHKTFFPAFTIVLPVISTKVLQQEPPDVILSYGLIKLSGDEFALDHFFSF